MTEDPTLSGPIESLQLMLRTLSMLDEELPTLVPDGIYGSATANAVSAFQKKHDLPITGIADRDTHQAIVDAIAAADSARFINAVTRHIARATDDYATDDECRAKAARIKALKAKYEV